MLSDILTVHCYHAQILSCPNVCLANQDVKFVLIKLKLIDGLNDDTPLVPPNILFQREIL